MSNLRKTYLFHQGMEILQEYRRYLSPEQQKVFDSMTVDELKNKWEVP